MELRVSFPLASNTNAWESAMEPSDLIDVAGPLELIDHGMHLYRLILGHPLGRRTARGWEQQPAYLQDFLETLHLQEFDGEHHA